MPNFTPPSSIVKNAHQAGFTLVEVVLALVIAGVLAAVAVPRFLNLGKDARIAAVQGLEGGVRSQVHISQMKCMATPECLTVANKAIPVTPTASNGLLVGMIYGIPRYPDVPNSIAGLLGAVASLDTTKGTLASFSVTVDNGPYDSGGKVTFQMSSAADPTNCKVIYEPGKWDTGGWVAPWNSSYQGGITNLPAVPLDQRYNVSSVSTGC